MPATIIIIVLIAAICVFAVRSIIVKSTRGCCGGASDKEQHIEKQDEGSYPYRYIIEVGGMTCKNCAARVENAFNKQDGFLAKVDLKENRAVVLAKQPASELILRKTICDIGYTVGEIKQDESVSC